MTRRSDEVNPYFKLAAQWGCIGVIACYTVYSLVDILKTDMRMMSQAMQESAKANTALMDKVGDNADTLADHVRSSAQTENLLRAVCYNNASNPAEQRTCVDGIPHGALPRQFP